MSDESERVRRNVDAMARALALYHAIFAREAAAMFGEKRGTELVERVVDQFGRERGRRIREETLAAGDALDLKGLNTHYDLPLGDAWESVKRDSGSDVTFCPMADEWKRSGMIKEGKFYCAVDFALAEGFSPDLRFSRFSSIMDEEPCCCHRYSDKTGK